MLGTTNFVLPETLREKRAKPKVKKAAPKKQRLWVRALMPTYVDAVQWDNRFGEYCPWVVGIWSTVPDQLSNEVLDAKFIAWRNDQGEDPFDPDKLDFSEFMEYLQKKKYVVYNVDTPGVWSPLGSRA